MLAADEVARVPKWRIPTVREGQVLLKSARHLPDAGMVVAMATMVELPLELRLALAMPKLNASLQNQVFRKPGPLSGIHSKAVMAEAMGILDEGMIRRLHVIVGIRTAFTQGSEAASFEANDIAYLIEREQMAAAMEQQAGDLGCALPLSRRDAFALYCYAAYLALIAACRTEEKIQRSAR